jgi:L-ornithine N5-oxygenase
MHIHGVIGIGFGPSNLALAVALQEAVPAGRLDALFIERQPSFAWHPDMLLGSARMQVSFLKDLATLRNPASRFTFLNYLHGKRRLQDFINLKTFYPSRHEFNDYLKWAAEQFAERCAYGEEVIEVLPEEQGDEVALLRIRSRTADGRIQERLARNLVLGVGGAASIPECFIPLREDGRIFHSSTYLRNAARHGAARRIAVVGAGQSAAELFLDLARRDAHTRVDLITRARTIKPSDDSPFVNEIFNPEYTDFVFSRPAPERAALLEEFMHTNYAAPDLALIEEIFRLFYEQKVADGTRHRFLRRHEIDAARSEEGGVALDLHDLDSGERVRCRYDAVVLATGYRRDLHRSLLAPLSPHLGDFAVERDYRLQAAPGFRPGIFVQGCCEPTHGLSDTLLSVLAVRTQEISQALLARGALTQPAAADGGKRLRLLASH